MNEVLNSIAKRSSTRGYTGEKLTEEELKQLMGAIPFCGRSRT